MIRLTAGSLNNNYIAVGNHLGFFPADAVGAANAKDGEGAMLTLHYAGLPDPVETDIAGKPQLDFRATTAAARVLKQEEPFHCVQCGKAFGTRSTIERVVAKLEGRHWMFSGPNSRLDVLKMCEDCRVAAVTETPLDPYAAPRPKPRTTEDYLREREKPKA